MLPVFTRLLRDFFVGGKEDKSLTLCYVGHEGNDDEAGNVQGHVGGVEV